MPNNVTGVSVFNQKSGEFDFHAGPIFVNILLVDEINRARSALYFRPPGDCRCRHMRANISLMFCHTFILVAPGLRS